VMPSVLEGIAGTVTISHFIMLPRGLCAPEILSKQVILFIFDAIQIREHHTVVSDASLKL
jgi:hypothetical protein